jgi:hypothetical protein
MQLFQMLQLLDAEVKPEHCKIHLASWNGEDDPYDVYLEGRFDEWQALQNKKNFERQLVVSLIALARPSQWLFAGVHDAQGCEAQGDGIVYRLRRRPGPNELDGRLIVRFERPGRQAYLLGEEWARSIEVAEILAERRRTSEFPGVRRPVLTKKGLDVIVKEGTESWRSALRSVAGVYVIADRRNGKLYVGSATGEGGIWDRWTAYSETGHGDNKELKDLLAQEGHAYADNFQFGVLETADTHATADDITERESYWKRLLDTRVPHGYNAN